MFVIPYIFGIIVGAVVTFIVCEQRNQPIGKLRIINSDESEEPYMFLEINESPKMLNNSSTVRLKVEQEMYYTQEKQAL